MPAPVATSTIAAQAFRLMELAPISSFADDTDQARAAAEQYDVALETCLEACDWSFASVFAGLSELAALPSGAAADPDLVFSYGLPGDCLALREVGDGFTRWRRDRDLVRADQAGPLPVRYTARIEDEDRLPATFRQAVSWRLAAMLAPAWSGTAARVQQLEDGAAQSLRQAMRQDARQASSERYDGGPDQPDWVEFALR